MQLADASEACVGRAERIPHFLPSFQPTNTVKVAIYIYIFYGAVGVHNNENQYN